MNGSQCKVLTKISAQTPVCVCVCVFVGGALCSPVREAWALPNFIGSSSGSWAAQKETTERRSAMAHLAETWLWQWERWTHRETWLIISCCAVEIKHLPNLCLLSAIAGVLHSDPEALRLAQAVSETEGVELTGVYAHCGNTYNCRGVEQIQAVAQETTNLILQFMEKYDKSNTRLFVL